MAAEEMELEGKGKVARAVGERATAVELSTAVAAKQVAEEQSAAAAAAARRVLEASSGS